MNDDKKNFFKDYLLQAFIKTKKEKMVEQIWKNISAGNDEANADEIYFMKLLARDIAQHEDLYDWLKKNHEMVTVISVIFGILGAVIMYLAKEYFSLDIRLVFLYVFVAILFEILAVIGVGLCWLSLKQLWQYHDTLYDNEQFLLLIEIATKTKEYGKNTDKELYARIIESELKRREQLVFQKKDTKTYK